jgi:molybdopterin-binding protein
MLDKKRERRVDGMKISARNQLKGTIVEIRDGAVNGVVVLDIGGGNTITSVITMAAIKELGLKPGGQAYAIVKASSVMIGVDD